MNMRESSSEGRQRVVMSVLLSIGAGLVLRALWLALTQRVALLVILGSTFHVIVTGLGLGLFALARASIGELRDPQSEQPHRGVAGPLRWAFVVAVLGWLLFVWRVQPFQRIWIDMALGGAAGAWALVLVIQRAAGGRHVRLARAIELMTFGACAAALGLELGLSLWANVRPAPINATVGAGPGELVQRFRCDPGQVRFGFACNSGGFYDTEFYRKDPADETPLIVAIGDSFNVGTVPHAWHFTSVCEQLTGAQIYNMGVPGIGPPEYLSLLVDEVLPLDPDVILVGIFVGNDLNIDDVLEGLPDAWLRRWFQRDQVLLFVIPERMSRVAEERARAQQRGANAGTVQGERATAGSMDRAQVAAAFPWLEDPALEEATLSEEAFYRIETERALDICAQVPASIDLLFESLLAMRRAAGEIPMRVMLIPDEFQVEDELWARVSERAGRELDRDRPQRLLSAWLGERGIPCLDLLPVLREVAPMTDGRRHLYHDLDTHFNARGNRATAEALADFLR